MNEQQLAQRFASAVAVEPPLGFDPDDVIDRAVLRQRRGRRVLGSAAAVVAVMVAAVVVSSQAPRGGTTAGAGSTPTVTGPSAEPEVAQNGLTGFPGSDRIVQALGRTAPEVLAEHVPGVSFGPPVNGWQADRNRNVYAAYPASPHRLVGFSLWHVRNELDLTSDAMAHDDKGLVSDTVRPDGSHLKVFHYTRVGSESLQVVHYRLDGVIVLASAEIKPVPGETALPADQQELTALAMDPRLTF